MEVRRSARTARGEARLDPVVGDGDGGALEHLLARGADVDPLPAAGGGLGERGELPQGVLRVLRGALGPDARQHHALQAQLAVLDLGHVLELGGQALHALEGVARGELVLVAVGVRVPVLALVQGECAARERAGAIRGPVVGGALVVRGHAVRGAAPGRLAVGGAASVIGGQDALDHGLDLVL